MQGRAGFCEGITKQGREGYFKGGQGRLLQRMAGKVVATQGREGYGNKLALVLGGEGCGRYTRFDTLSTPPTLVWHFAHSYSHQQLQLHTGSMANSPSSQGSWQYTQISRPAPTPGAGAPGPNTSAGTLD